MAISEANLGTRDPLHRRASPAWVYAPQWFDTGASAFTHRQIDGWIELRSTRHMSPVNLILATYIVVDLESCRQGLVLSPASPWI